MFVPCDASLRRTVFHGRREKNEMRLLVRDDKGKLKVERWPIAGTVAINPHTK